MCGHLNPFQVGHVIFSWVSRTEVDESFSHVVSTKQHHNKVNCSPVWKGWNSFLLLSETLERFNLTSCPTDNVLSNHLYPKELKRFFTWPKL